METSPYFIFLMYPFIYISMLITIQNFPQLDLLPKGLRFSYDDPQSWRLSYPQCGGNYQSPIPLSLHKAIPIGLPPLHFGHYDLPFDELLSVRNNGHTGMYAGPTKYS